MLDRYYDEGINTEFDGPYAFEWADPHTTDPIKHWLFDVSSERDCVSDSIELPDEELMGLTILDHPHITACGSIVESQLHD